MIRIFIADDHALIREGLKRLIENEHGFTVVGESENPQEIFTFLQTNKCDLLLLDLSFPNVSGLEILKDLNASHPEIKILILSMHPEEQFAKRALKSGASGYLHKESMPNEIIKAINKVTSGGKYISSAFAEKLVADLDNSSLKKPYELLSDREFQILRMIASGKSYKDISDELNLGLTTISTYRSRILEKLKLSSNAEIIRYALRNNLIE